MSRADIVGAGRTEISAYSNAQRNPMRARFGSFVLDGETRELLRDDERLHLSKKAFDLLLHLVNASPRVVTKREILDTVWPETFVSDTTVAAVVAELRSVLGDDAREPRFVRTVHGIGYAFCADVASTLDTPSSGVQCRLIWGDREITLADGVNILGRNRDAFVWIDHPSISRRHVAINVSGDAATIEDLGSKNGTFIDGERIHGRRPLTDGNQVLIGKVAMTFRVFREAVPTETSF